MGVKIIISVVVLVNNNTEIEAYYYALPVFFTKWLAGVFILMVLNLYIKDRGEP